MSATVAPETLEKGRSLWRDAWSRLCRDKAATVGLVLLSVLSLASFLAPVISPYAYDAQDLALGAVGPSWRHWCGTDTLGRDLFTRVLYGGRVSLAVGLCATLVSLSVGVTYGAIAGYVGGRTDAVMTRIIDALYALPFTIFVIILMVLFGRNFALIFIAIGAVEWLTMARVVRARTQSIKLMEYIEAARALGLSGPVILARHVLPNCLGVIIVYATLTVPRVILIEAFLSFLGLGVQPPMSSWGSLIGQGAEVMEEYPWALFFPGAVFSAALFSLNFLGDGLRDAFDPKSARD